MHPVGRVGTSVPQLNFSYSETDHVRSATVANTVRAGNFLCLGQPKGAECDMVMIGYHALSDENSSSVQYP